MQRGARICAAVVVGAVLLFGAWQLVMPPGFESVRGLNPRAVLAWWSWWGGGAVAPVVPLELYRAFFRAFIVLAWLGYGGLLWFVSRGARLGSGWTWPLAIPVIVTLAVAVPATLSTDVFAYVGYARLAVVHGLNPHLYTQADLVRLGDPTTPYLRWPIPSPYGPLWTLFSMAVVFVGRRISTAASETAAIVGPVIAFKLAAGVGLLGAAAAARAIVRRRAPQQAAAVFVLVALNPLLLVEGPANGHNDLVMMALLLAAIAALAVGRSRRAAVLLGIGGAFKLVPLIAVPWLAALAARARSGFDGSARTLAAVFTVGLALLPVVLAYAPLWSGPRTLGGVMARWQKGDPASLPVPGARGSVGGPREGAAATETTRERRSDTDASTDMEVGARRIPWGLLRRLLYAAPAILIYLWATLAICLGQGEGAYRLATVWSYVALGILCFAAGLWCSWYLVWLWPTLVLRFTRAHLILAAFAVPFSLLLMLAYATPPG